jgi:hypothetical protein
MGFAVGVQICLEQPAGVFGGRQHEFGIRLGFRVGAEELGCLEALVGSRLIRTPQDFAPGVHVDVEDFRFAIRRGENLFGFETVLRHRFRVGRNDVVGLGHGLLFEGHLVDPSLPTVRA